MSIIEKIAHNIAFAEDKKLKKIKEKNASFHNIHILYKKRHHLRQSIVRSKQNNYGINFDENELYFSRQMWSLMPDLILLKNRIETKVTNIQKQINEINKH